MRCFKIGKKYKSDFSEEQRNPMLNSSVIMGSYNNKYCGGAQKLLPERMGFKKIV
jgi:hypothetical protein